MFAPASFPVFILLKRSHTLCHTVPPISAGSTDAEYPPVFVIIGFIIVYIHRNPFVFVEYAHKIIEETTLRPFKYRKSKPEDCIVGDLDIMCPYAVVAVIYAGGQVYELDECKIEKLRNHRSSETIVLIGI